MSNRPVTKYNVNKDWHPHELIYNHTIKIGVVIATYYRPNGATLKKITKALKSVVDQSYAKWMVILIGDKYENQEEFEQIAKMVPKERIVYKNLDHAVERELYQAGKITQRQLWNTAGSNAMREGVLMAKQMGIKHIAHLDDDDYWYPNHLVHIWRAFCDFPEASFIYTSGYWGNGLLCPYFDWKIEYNNKKPKMGNVLHSAVAWRTDKIEPLYHLLTPNNLDELLPNCRMKKIDIPADGYLWARIAEYCEKNDLKYLYLPILTVVHCNMD